jgi:hypothetical protein
MSALVNVYNFFFQRKFNKTKFAYSKEKLEKLYRDLYKEYDIKFSEEGLILDEFIGERFEYKGRKIKTEFLDLTVENIRRVREILDTELYKKVIERKKIEAQNKIDESYEDLKDNVAFYIRH